MDEHKPHLKHREHAPKRLRFALFTVSTSRFMAMVRGESLSDESMDAAVNLVRRGGHEVIVSEIINDDITMIREKLIVMAGREDIDAIVFMGGTGLTSRDVTIEAVRPLLEKEAEGFGELLRFLSYRDIGAAAALTRSTAGVMRGKAVFCIPGSPRAVELFFKEFLGEIGHMVYLARR